MTAIKPAIGSVKLSEVAMDEDASSTAIALPKNTDALTMAQQMRRTISDSLQKNGALLYSSGVMSWNGSQISFNGGASNLILKFLSSETGSVWTHTMTGGGSDTATTFNSISLSSGEILYIEFSRALANGNQTIENAVGGGSAVSGKTAKKGSSIPALQSSQSAAFQGTTCIPLAINIGGLLYWVQSGMVWGAGTTALVGEPSTTSIPGTQNYFLNGGFDVAQRIPTLNSFSGLNSGTNYLHVDMWRFSSDLASGSPAVARVNSSPTNGLSSFSCRYQLSNSFSPSTNPVTATASTDRINQVGHGFPAGSPILFSSISAGGLTTTVFYFVQNPTANDYQLSLSPSGPIVDITSDGSGFIGQVYSGVIAHVQRVESDRLRELVNKKISISFWYKLNATTFPSPSKVKLLINAAGGGKDNYGSLGPDLGPVTEQALIRDGAWHQMKFENITVDPTMAQGAEFNFNFRGVVTTSGVGSVAPLDVSQFMMNEGSVATDFRAYRSPEDEVIQCQRFFRKSYNMDVAVGAATNVGALYQAGGSASIQHSATVQFGAPMKAAPTIAYYTTLGVVANVNEIDSAGTLIGGGPAAGVTSSTGSFVLQRTLTVNGRGLVFHWTAEIKL